MGDFLVSRHENRPGWRWSQDVKPRAGTDFCTFHHHGYTVSGTLHVETKDGAEMNIGPGDIYEIPPGHDAWVVGDDAWVSIDWAPTRSYGLETGASVKRTLATLLFTDIVGSTDLARHLGDSRWQDLLAEHNRVVRDQLARFGGREIDTTGDGFLALFDAAEAAVRAGLEIVSAIEALDLKVRVGIHTGEVEMEGNNVRGLSVHVASRILNLAGPSEVLVSWTTHALLSGSDIDCEHRGTHELKGLEGKRAVYQALPAKQTA